MTEMVESQVYVLAWPEGDGENDVVIRTMVNHDLPESDLDHDDPEYTRVRTYTRDQLRATDTVVTDANEAKALVMRATPEEPIAIPVSIARELDWFPDASYRRFKPA
jgi:hypothetical protein